MISLRTWLPAVMAASAVAFAAVPGQAANAAEPGPIEVPAGVTTGYVLFDRDTNTVTTQLNQDKQFRSASVVKLLIALDYLTRRGTLRNVPAGDKTALERMLRSSDDIAARTFYQSGGRTAVIHRMVHKIGLKHTQPPADPDFWGYTALSASDIVKVYQYLLKDNRQGFGKFILDNVHQFTKCAIDGRDQSFGIPRAVPTPFGAKQGWSGFGEAPAREACAATAEKSAGTGKEFAAEDASWAVTAKSASNIDLKNPLLHTTGLVDNDRKILVVLTLFPAKTSWEKAAVQITDLTKSVYASAGTNTTASEELEED